MNLYDVRVMNDNGVWSTDLTTGSRRRAFERYRFLIARTIVELRDQSGRMLTDARDA